MTSAASPVSKTNVGAGLMIFLSWRQTAITVAPVFALIWRSSIVLPAIDLGIRNE
jgi:hypothetical protein